MRFVSHAFRLVVLAMLALVVFHMQTAQALTDKTLYQMGQERLAAKKGDLALLYFRELIREYPDSEYANDAHFLIARYYMDSRNYFQANRQLREHLQIYPSSPYADQIMTMLAELEVVDLESRALKAMQGAEYRVAKVLWEDVLAKNPNHALAKRNLAECDRIIERMNYQKRQLERERERIEAESKAIANLLKEARAQREQAEQIRQQAAEMDAKTRTKYEAALEEANRLSAELEGRIEALEADLKLWRDRARKYEARLLQEPDIGPLEGLASQEFPKIIFEGPEADPFPEVDEQQVAGLVLDASPTVVLVGEYNNRETNVLKAEIVASVDLETPWPREQSYYLKVRIDFQAIADENGMAAPIPSKTIYSSLADMDDVDPRNKAYRKKMIVSVDKNIVDTYTVAAYFVKKTEP